MPVVLGGDHTIALPDVTGVARHVGFGNVSVLHFDAHADTGNTQLGSLYGHGTPMRRLLESGACRGDRFVQIGLRGYWPEPETLAWMAEQHMRSYEMTEVVTRAGSTRCWTRPSSVATDGCDAVFVSVDVDVVDPGSAPGTGTPEPGGLSSRQLLDAVRRITMEAAGRGAGRRRGVAPLRPRRGHRVPREPRRPRSALRARVAAPRDAGHGAARTWLAAPGGALAPQRIESRISRTISMVVSGLRNANLATVSPSQDVGVTMAT